jgi:biopolymer transport protein ExbB
MTSSFIEPHLPILAQEPTSGMGLILDFLATGGYVMGLIVLCSIAAVAVMIMVYLQLRDDVVMPTSVISQLRSLPNYAAKGDIRPLQDFLERDPSVLARLGSLAISGEYTSKPDCVEAVATQAKQEIHRMERGVPFLEVMVTVAPLLGLMGTTAALVGMFSAFGAEGQNGPDTTAVAREIGVALRCTIAGLFVAVPSVLAHTYFARRLDAIAVKIESTLHDVIHTFFAHFEVHREEES